MAKQKNLQKQDGLERLVFYILGQRPDEFGLYPTPEGFVAIKDLLAALHEEEGFKGVREGQLLMMANQPGDLASVEISDKSIRLKPGLAQLPPEAPPTGAVPKILYLCLKERAWRVIAEEGLRPKTGENFVLLWADEKLAQKVGRRFAPQSLLIKINTNLAQNKGSFFKAYSELLWLAPFIVSEALSGPKLPPLEEAPKKKKIEKETPGSFFIPSPSEEPITHQGKKKGKYQDAPDWKIQTRRDRRKRTA